MVQMPLEFDRRTGALTGANVWERLVALLLIVGAKISSTFWYRGYDRCANLLRKTVPARDVTVKLNSDATFAFPYADGYWSKLFNRSFEYEGDFKILLKGVGDVDYTMIDCGANYGYWSVLVSSAPFGSRNAIAIEPSSKNFEKLAYNAKINGGRFRIMHCAIGAQSGTARLSGSKHEAFSIAPDSGNDSGEVVPVVAVDDLLDRNEISPTGKYLIKLDVEGVEIEAIRGCKRILERDSIIFVEDHGNDRNHTVSRFILDETPLKLIVFDPATDRFETLTDVSTLDRIKEVAHVGYNVFGTASPFWEQRIQALNESSARHI